MKKLILALLFLSPLFAYSQNNSIGVKCGGVISSMPNFPNSKPMLGRTVGLIYAYNNGNTQFSVEPSYIMKGVAQDITGGTAKNKFHYLEVPIVVNQTLVCGKINFGINTGLSPAILLRARYVTPTTNIEVPITNMFNLDFITGIKISKTICANNVIALNLRAGFGVVTPLNHNYVSSFVTYQKSF